MDSLSETSLYCTLSLAVSVASRPSTQALQILYPKLVSQKGIQRLAPQLNEPSLNNTYIYETLFLLKFYFLIGMVDVFSNSIIQLKINTMFAWGRVRSSTTQMFIK